MIQRSLDGSIAQELIVTCSLGTSGVLSRSPWVTGRDNSNRSSVHVTDLQSCDKSALLLQDVSAVSTAALRRPGFLSASQAGAAASCNPVLSFCRHELHVIVDEIYMLSVFDESATFHSVLGMDRYNRLPPPRPPSSDSSPRAALRARDRGLSQELPTPRLPRGRLSRAVTAGWQTRAVGGNLRAKKGSGVPDRAHSSARASPFACDGPQSKTPLA